MEVPDFSKLDYSNDFSKTDYFSIPQGAKRHIETGSFAGKTSTTEGYIDSDGVFVANGVITIWDDPAHKRKLREAHMLAGKLHGVLTVFYPNGSKGSQASMVSNEKHGQTKTWYESGQLQTEVPYYKNKQHGVSKRWHKDGQLAETKTWVDDQLNGPCDEWHPNGKKKEVSQYKNGLLHGWRQEWEEDEAEASSGFFETGKPVGKHRFGYWYYKYIDNTGRTAYHVEVDDQPWSGGTKVEFIAKMQYFMKRTRPNITLQFNPIQGIATCVADNPEAFFAFMGRPAQDVQDLSKRSAPLAIRDQYRIWTYNVQDATLRLRVQPTQDQTILIMIDKR